MGYDCFCDYDPPAYYEKRIVKRARKAHQCCECGGAISEGESYEYVSGVWDGHFDTFKTCISCCDITQWVANNVPCLCWAHGNRIDDCKTAVEEAAFRAPDETRGLRFGFARRVFARDRINKERTAKPWPFLL